MLRHELVEDKRLPEGVDWLMVRETSGERFLFVRESCCAGDCDACPVLARIGRDMAIFV